MRVILRDQLQHRRGTWSLITYKSGRRSALLVCPDCGTRIALAAHSVHDDGVVTPRVRCTTAGCSFHDVIRLSAWPRAAA